MTEVKIGPDDSFEAALKRFTKKVGNAGIIQEVRSRQAYEKPSDIKRKKKAAGKARHEKLRRKTEELIKYQNENKHRPRRKNNDSAQSDNRRFENKRNNKPRSEYQKPRNTSRPKITKKVSDQALKDLQDKFSR